MIDRIRAMVEEYQLIGLFRELHFPISKQELIEIAEEHNAPQRAIELLNLLPDTAFDSVGQLLGHLHSAKEGD